MTTTIVVVLGALCGGFVTGLAGFGTGLTALAFWLHVVNPVVAAALVAACSVVGQAQSLFTVRRAITWRRVWPFMAGGVIGVPVGVASLRWIDPQTLKVFLGLLLICYTGVMLGVRRYPTIAWGGKVADGVIGFGGGALGGVAGLSGPLPTIWCGLRGWNADAQRAVYQPFNLTILAIALCAHILLGNVTEQVWRLIFMCIPATILGAYLGIRMYGRVNDQQFRVLVLWLLLISGIVLTVSNLT
ncbi:MAG TPA: sulfite exporter TauE/SafE family protein [Desulfobacterales bacterium]|nr:sulfite exporter TauE/SafE family protein [Desulfobacterales bacterium]